MKKNPLTLVKAPAAPKPAPASNGGASPFPEDAAAVEMIEWGASSYFSFLEGCSSPSQIIQESMRLGLRGLGLADRMGLYGCVEALRAYDTGVLPGQGFFYAPGIRLHFDHADPLIVYPLHKQAHSWLCSHISDWALESVDSDFSKPGSLQYRGASQEKGIPPLHWKKFLSFLERHSKYLSESFLFFSVPGRFFPWPESSREEFSRSETQDVMRVAPSVAVPPQHSGLFPLWLKELSQVCGGGEDSSLSLMWPLTLAPGIQDLQSWILKQSHDLNIPLVASSLPLMATSEDHELAQLVCSIRHRKTLDSLGLLGNVNKERRLLGPRSLQMHKHIYEQTVLKHGQILPGDSQSSNFSHNSKLERACPFKRSLKLKERHNFSLKELHYSYPIEKIPDGKSSAEHLREMTYQGANKRYCSDAGIPLAVQKQLKHELKLIEQLGFEDYFLTIVDVLRYADKEKILYQGRGSAANSAVCYCLGITAIDPVKMDLLFERFLSLERHEAPDIDIDFEHERREEVLQQIYAHYGRDRSAMVANTIRFRGRMSMRESGKALGLTEEELKQISSFMGREGIKAFSSDFTETLDPYEKKAIEKRSQVHATQKTLSNKKHTDASLKEFAPHVRRKIPALLRLAQKLVGLPRHMGIHSCGFVLAHGDLRKECILEPARKKGRSIIPWNKDDVDYLRWVKVDFLSLGMLTALRKCFDAIGENNPSGQKLSLASVPQDCPKTYRDIRRADTVGVFQIESRAQMNMLPQLAPKNFYDLVIEVAIVRPGPLQGGMVHPFIRRRQGKEKPSYAHPRLKKVLGKTLGVPIFQEQVMKMAVEVADFTPGESEQMRKVMSSAWRSRSQMHKLKTKLITGMRRNGISQAYAESIYKQMEAFGEYGFPESHSASFAILAYISSWLKTHYPAAFLCSLLNSQPMGFYSPRALIGDAQRHGVRTLPIDIRYSQKDSLMAHPDAMPLTENIPVALLESGPVRLGLQHIHGLKEEDIEQILRLQKDGYFKQNPYPHARELRAHLSLSCIETLTRAGAIPQKPSLKGNRNSKKNIPEELWKLKALKKESFESPTLFENTETQGRPPKELQSKWNRWEELLNEYRQQGFSIDEHPAHYARINFFPLTEEWTSSEELWEQHPGKVVTLLGLLAVKQKPPTAKGMCFLTLEDEKGFINLAILPEVYSKVRRDIDTAPLIAARGVVQKSAPSSAADARTSSLSVMVKELWNPFREHSAAIFSQKAENDEPISYNSHGHPRNHNPFRRRQSHTNPTGNVK